MALFSSGMIPNEDRPEDPGPLTTTGCVFEGNRAEEGGAIYSAAGYEQITDCWFEDNFAGIMCKHERTIN